MVVLQAPTEQMGLGFYALILITHSDQDLEVIEHVLEIVNENRKVINQSGKDISVLKVENQTNYPGMKTFIINTEQELNEEGILDIAHQRMLQLNEPSILKKNTLEKANDSAIMQAFGFPPTPQVTSRIFGEKSFGKRSKVRKGGR